MTTITDDFLTGVADDYRRHLPTGRPSVEIAAERGVPAATVRRWVMEARARGFLDPTTQGRMSGEPEPEKKRVIRAAALREAADLAHAEGNRLYDDSGQRHAQGAWAVRDALRARANEIDPQTSGS